MSVLGFNNPLPPSFLSFQIPPIPDVVLPHHARRLRAIGLPHQRAHGSDVRARGGGGGVDAADGARLEPLLGAVRACVRDGFSLVWCGVMAYWLAG